jgi:hypothetical protein
MFGAVGAGVSLAIAASLALLVVSSVVAFRGWPDDAAAPRNPEVAQLSATRAEAKQAAAISEIVSLPKAFAHGTARATTQHGTVQVDPATAQNDAATTGESSSQASQASASDSAATDGPSRAPSSNVVKPVTDTVRDTTKAVADAVAPVAPSVAGALESVGAAGADTVDSVGQVANGVVGNVLP